MRAGHKLAAVVAGAVALSMAAAPQAQQTTPAPMEIDGRKSGYLFMESATRMLQDDDFLNPAMFAVDTGRMLWSQPDGAAGQSCADCHGAAEDSMRGVAARYPLHDAELGQLVNIESRINDCRTRRMEAPALPHEGAALLGLSAYVGLQSRGMPMEVEIDGPAAPYFEAGREYFHARRGQLDLACSHCHDDLVGQRLRGDVVSQGQINGFPIYRLMWDAVASRHRMFEWCNTSLRAEPNALGSDVYLALELYLAWRGRGLAVETPAVRR